jgi:hypothetical protein
VLQSMARGTGGFLCGPVHNGPSTVWNLSFYAANSKVVALAKANDGARAADYENGARVQGMRSTGPRPKAHQFRWCTKCRWNTTDLALCEYRPYSPAQGRWLSRDSILETAFSSLLGDDHDEAGMNRGVVEGGYCFVRNRAVLGLDNLGLQGGLLCECGYTPPDKGFPSSKKNVIIIDRGRAVCSNANLGEIVTFTHVGIPCRNRILVPRRCCDCDKRRCSARYRYQCGLWLGKHHWLFLDVELVKRCL